MNPQALDHSLVAALQRFHLVRFKAVFEVRDVLDLPEFAGSPLRGTFGHAFKDVVCMVSHRTCEKCLLLKRCPYPYVFETPLPESSDRMRRYEHVPHPFWLELLSRERHYNVGAQLHMGFTLVGKAISLLPYILLGLEGLGERGLTAHKSKMRLVALERMNLDGASEVIYRPGENLYDAPDCWVETLDWGISSGGPVSLTWVTPLRIKGQEKMLTSELPFDRLISSILRRLSMLCYFHHDFELDLPFKELVEQARGVKVLQSDLHWHDVPRYSNRQQQAMNMGGMLGTVSYGTESKAFWPLLWLGQYLRAGKGTVFGLGQYELGSLTKPR